MKSDPYPIFDFGRDDGLKNKRKSGGEEEKQEMELGFTSDEKSDVKLLRAEMYISEKQSQEREGWNKIL